MSPISREMFVLLNLILETMRTVNRAKFACSKFRQPPLLTVQNDLLLSCLVMHILAITNNYARFPHSGGGRCGHGQNTS